MHLLQGDDVDADHARLDLIGGPQTTPHYPRGWAMASNTPFRLYKINTHAGGHTVPCIVSWPERFGAAGVGGAFRRQYAHLTDVLPTLCDLIGIDPTVGRGGAEPLLRWPAPASSRPSPTPTSPAAHRVTVEEMNGHRGYYEDGWEVVTLHQPLTPFDDDEWELYDLTTDPVELDDRSAAEPERRAAHGRGVGAGGLGQPDLPPRRGQRDQVPGAARTQRGLPRAGDDRRRHARRSSGGGRVQLIWFRSVTITVDIDFVPGDHGILVAHGDQGGGYALYVLDDELRFVHNDGRGHAAPARRAVRSRPVPASVAARLDAVGEGVWTLALDGRRHRARAGWPACRCSTAWRRSRASTSASTGGRR